MRSNTFHYPCQESSRENNSLGLYMTHHLQHHHLPRLSSIHYSKFGKIEITVELLGRMVWQPMSLRCRGRLVVCQIRDRLLDRLRNSWKCFCYYYLDRGKIHKIHSCMIRTSSTAKFIEVYFVRHISDTFDYLNKIVCLHSKFIYKMVFESIVHHHASTSRSSRTHLYCTYHTQLCVWCQSF